MITFQLLHRIMLKRNFRRIVPPATRSTHFSGKEQDSTIISLLCWKVIQHRNVLIAIRPSNILIQVPNAIHVTSRIILQHPIQITAHRVFQLPVITAIHLHRDGSLPNLMSTILRHSRSIKVVTRVNGIHVLIAIPMFPIIQFSHV